jgi:GNAT superfamily N-acetyltransferase
VVRPDLLLTDTIAAEMEAVIGGGLNAFNDDVVGYADRKPIAVVARDPETGSILGGALGRSSLGLLFLELLYLPEQCRGAGIGGEILRLFEHEGRKRGCVAGVLYTISFQAPAFYERHGWRRFGEVACRPEGTSRIFLSKQLDRS